MKLPDFREFAPFNQLKHQMGISRDTYGSFEVQDGRPRLTVRELDALTSGEGLDVSFDDLTVLPDGTLAYKDSRVLLYIRDITEMGGRTHEPRYHLSSCTTLQEMTAKGKFEKYVVAADANGAFQLNVVNGTRVRTERRRLRVCQNCLAGLNFDGFSFSIARSQRETFVAEFMPNQFFEIYPRSLHSVRPKYSSLDAPLNNYTADFGAISTRIRSEVGWQCENCHASLNDLSLRRFLHVHHKDGIKSNNKRSNLMALCIGCHAEQPDHHHLRGHKDYSTYVHRRIAS